jgi:hypothetical protein
MPSFLYLLFFGLDYFAALVGSAARAGVMRKNGFPAFRAGGQGRGGQAFSGPALVPAGFGHFSLGQTHEQSPKYLIFNYKNN